MRVLAWYLGGLLLATSACESTSGTSTITLPTVVTLEPSVLPGVSCAADIPESVDSRSFRSYVVTVVDTTPFLNSWQRPYELCNIEAANDRPDAAIQERPTSSTDGWTCKSFPLPSAPPLPCDQAVAFSNVLPTHRYTARVDGYNRTDLTPVAPGSPILLDPDRNPVAPQWVWICDQDNIAASNRSVDLRGCRLLSQPPEPAVTAVYVDLQAVLGGLPCGTGAGQVDHLSVIPDPGSSTSFGPLESLRCDALPTFEVDAGALFSVRVNAFSAGVPAPQWTTRCATLGRTGTLLPADCDPLRPIP